MTGTTKLDHLDEGTGSPALLLIHGLCCDYTDWKPQLEAFSNTHRVITPTLRGHGGEASDAATLTMETLAADVVALAREKAVSDVIVAGHSMGTRVAHEVWKQAPDIVKGIILVDGSNRALENPADAINQFNATTEGDKLKPWLAGLFNIMFYGDRFADLRSACVARALAMPDENVRALYRNMLTWDAIKGDAVIRAVNVPTLVLQSTTPDTDFVRRALNEGEMGHYPEVVKERNTNAELALLAGHGHFTGLEAPKWTNDAISAWMTHNSLV
jgi:pimeloyl-ACP methyl ester carboxylesterase